MEGVLNRGAAWLFTLALGVAGCGEKTSREANAPDGASGSGPAAGRALVLVLREVNTDGFDGTLAEDQEEVEAVAAELADGVLRLAPEVAEVEDAVLLRKHGIVLADGHTPLSRCALVVLHETVYEGPGRLGGALRVYGFPTREGVVPLGLAERVDVVEHDPATSAVDLMSRLRAVRLAPGPGVELVLRPGEGVGVVVSAFGREHRIAAGARATWETALHAVRVKERALLAESVEFDGLEPADPGEVILPETDFGEVAFSTTWSVENAGVVDRTIAAAPEEGGDLR